MAENGVSGRWRGAASVAGVVALSLLASGCGAAKRDANANVVRGKTLFLQRCGSCHILARAGTKGIIGPNLDAAFRQSLIDGTRRSSIDTVVHGQILYPNPRGAMPQNLARGQDVANIAAYVSHAVDNPGQDNGQLAFVGTPAGGGKPVAEAAGKLQIDADPNGGLAFVTGKASGSTGPVTIAMKNTSGVSHNIALQQGTAGPVLGQGPVVAGGGVSSFKATLAPGSYTYFCQVPGHRAAGMLGTLTVK